ncbi:MAG TPA: precorrin-4 C(11)-methyltransferase [Methanoregulaceae archaeon]|nr:precorrin-4 C(11)-methyltransferase [Methanoregulaceae archaeon]
MEKIYFVGAGPGDPDLITVKGNDLLQRADVLIYTGSLVNPALVDRSHATIKVDSWGKTLEEIVPLMVTHARSGKRVVRLHSGDPSLFGAIVEQMQRLREEEIEYEVIPGVSSMFGAAAALQTQLTLGGVSDTVIVTRPAGETLDYDNITELSGHGATMVVFLGAAHFEEVISKVQYPPETPAAVVYKATWPDQKIITGTVADIARKASDAGINRTALLIIGGILSPAHAGHRRSALYS